MSNHKFVASFSGDAESLFGKLTAALKEHGGSVKGDKDGGAIEVSSPLGAVEGTYRVEGRNIRIELTRKPFLVPASKIEELLRQEIGRS